ncbi:MAG TPA: hypothetical protein VHA06_18375 [Candidatus Angelobacter sp.]|jgi:hypothetical protein|nr:hypothetical protein [Candidatus Angelobacter sp.]
MPAPSQSFGTADSQNNARPDSAEPLPLFRPEAVLAQQQKFYGEIVLIRPLSLMLLSWFTLGITAAVFGFLFLGHYTERAHVSGVIALSPAADSPAAKVLEASLFVPGRLIGRLHPGSQFTLHCEACSTPFSQQTGTVLAIPNAPLGPAELSQIDSSMSGSADKSPADKGPVYKITVSLPPQAALVSQLNPSPQTGMKVEADIPLGRKPLIKWFFERSAS